MTYCTINTVLLTFHSTWILNRWYRVLRIRLSSFEPKSTLGTNCIFEIDDRQHKPICFTFSYNVEKYKIDPYFFGFVKDKPYRGIRIYFDRESQGTKPEPRGKDDTLLLLEFIKSANSKIHVNRMDVNGNWWSEETVDYHDDKKLLRQLVKIKSDAVSVDSNITILYKKNHYKGVKEVTSYERKDAYNKYTYTFSEAKNTVTLFNRQKVTIGDFLGEFKTRKTDVYYLKAKLLGRRVRRQTQDTHPFLVVFNDDRSRKGGHKIYHFGRNYGLKNWLEFRKKNGIEVLRG